MFRNMAVSLIRSVRVDEDDEQRPYVPGRIVTTVAKAKELRPYVEKLVTLARKAKKYEDEAAQHATDADRNTDQWKAWRTSDEWQRWNQAIAPSVAMRRRAFSVLRDKEAVSILFDELASKFEDRDGGYTRVIRLGSVRLGDSGPKALIEFVGERDRVRRKRREPLASEPETVSEDKPADASAADDAAAGTDDSPDAGVTENKDD